MAMLILGSHLGPYLQQEVKRAFMHRFTGNHLPAWAAQPRANGQAYPLQFADDADWLAHTYFWITVKGSLCKRPAHCHSSPTWPKNPELRKDFIPIGISSLPGAA